MNNLKPTETFPHTSYAADADKIIGLVRNEEITAKYIRYGMHVAKLLNEHIRIYDEIDVEPIGPLLNVTKAKLRIALDEALIELSEYIDDYIRSYGMGYSSYEKMVEELCEYCDKVRLISYVLDDDVTTKGQVI